ncbi:hypothetical protein B0H16DRAFT_1713903 [Mycena metata]|uniref:Uncharacterized protein n=1 Tax=Mycena metata TaxID=1033252 RepID=A0AAD7JXQ7_9AGAR|nr:hypothetical protein B0H16DRAFT_1713903 [Mycena metata]
MPLEHNILPAGGGAPTTCSKDSLLNIELACAVKTTQWEKSPSHNQEPLGGHRYSCPVGDDIDTLLAFIGRSACSLTHLALRVHAFMEDLFLLQCLQVLPLLEDLRVVYKQQGARTLCNHLRSLDTVPRLCSLSFSELELGTPGYAYPPLVQMLQCRRRMRTAPSVVPRLSSFGLSFVSSRAMLPLGPDAEKLRRLVEGGLRLRIHGRGLEWPEGQYIEEQLDFPHPHRRLQVGAA